MLAIRLILIQRDNGRSYTMQVLSQQAYDNKSLPYKRGRITDAKGTVLADSQLVYNVIVDTKAVVSDETKNYLEPTLDALEKLGADEVLFPERDMGRRIAHNLVSGSIIDYLELSPTYSMAEVRPMREWIGKSLEDLSLRSSRGINIIAIKHGEDVDPMPRPETVIREEDVLLVVARDDTLARMDR